MIYVIIKNSLKRDLVGTSSAMIFKNHWMYSLHAAALSTSLIECKAKMQSKNTQLQKPK